MNQTSEQFFDEMLKDNIKHDATGNFQEQLADMIDRRISETMKKFEDQFSQIQQPAADPAEAAAEAAAAQGLPEAEEPTESGLLTEE